MSGSVILLPGIMGSALRSPGSSPVDLWTSDLKQNYAILIKNPAILKYNDTLPPDTPVEIIRTYRIHLFHTYGVFGRVMDFVQNYCIDKNLALIKFPYDWRQSLVNTAKQLGAELVNKSTPFTFIAHSMGGLVIRVALADGYVQPNHVARIIQIASPLGGSARAFRALYHDFGMPFLSFLTVWLNWRYGDTALKLLQDTMKTFDSIYELFPPEQWQFLNTGIGGWISPLGQVDPILLAKHKNRVRIVHDKVRQSISILKRSTVYVHTIRSDGLDTDTKYNVFVNKEKELYEFHPPIPYEEVAGDARVTRDSSTYSGMDKVDDIRDVTAVKHAKMCDSYQVVENLKRILP